MDFIIGLIAKIGSTPQGQVFLTWLVSNIWKYIEEGEKRIIAQYEISEAITNSLKEYDIFLKQNNSLDLNKLTEDQKNEIRQKKIALQTAIFNKRP